MPVSQQHRLCFVHIPKTAGTTIERALDIQNAASGYATEPHPVYGVCPQHLSLRQLEIEHPDLDRFTSFTIVRHPLDRLVSEYHFYRCNPKSARYHDLDFDGLVEALVKMDPRERLLAFDAHLETQKSFLSGARLADDVLVFRFEELRKLFKWLRRRTGKRLKFGHVRRAKRRGWKRYFGNPDTLERAVIHYREDFEAFGYPIPRSVGSRLQKPLRGSVESA